MDYNLNQRIRGPSTDSIKVHVVSDKKNFQSFPNISLGKTCDPNTEPFGILGQVWYLIVSIPDLCNLITLIWTN